MQEEDGVADRVALPAEYVMEALTLHYIAADGAGIICSIAF